MSTVDSNARANVAYMSTVSFEERRARCVNTASIATSTGHTI